MKLYTKEHLWLEQKDGNNYGMGVTPYGLDQLGEIAYVGDIAKTDFKKGDVMLTLESAKACHDILAPCDLRVMSAARYPLSCELANNGGHLCDIHIHAEDIGDTMTEEQYAEYCEEN